MYSLMCVRRTSVHTNTHTHTHRSIFESSSVCGSVSARVCMNFSGWHGADSQMEKFAACEHVSGQIKKKKKKKNKKGLIKKKGRAGFMKASNTHSATFYGLGTESWDPSRVLQWRGPVRAHLRLGLCFHLVPDLLLLGLSVNRRIRICAAFRGSLTETARGSCPAEATDYGFINSPASLRFSELSLHTGPRWSGRGINRKSLKKQKMK